MKKDVILSKKEAQVQMEYLRLSLNAEDIKVGRFFLKNGSSKDGLGICFVYYYHGLLSRNSFVNYLLWISKSLFPKRFKKHYAIYVRAFGGKNSRKADFKIEELTELFNYDKIGNTFMANGDEWVVKDGVIVNVKTLKPNSLI